MLDRDDFLRKNPDNDENLCRLYVWVVELFDFNGDGKITEDEFACAIVLNVWVSSLHGPSSSPIMKDEFHHWVDQFNGTSLFILLTIIVYLRIYVHMCVENCNFLYSILPTEEIRNFVRMIYHEGKRCVLM